MVIAFVHIAPHRQHRQRIECRQQMELRCWDNAVDDDLSEIPDIEIDGVDQKQTLYPIGKGIDGIEDGRHPHDELGQNAPQVLHIAEKDEQRRQDQPHAQIEDHQTHDGIEQQNELPRERDTIQCRKSEEDQQRQPKVDKGGHVLRQQEQVLRHIHLGKYTGVAHKGVHAKVGGIGKVGEHQLTGKQVNHIVVHVVAKKVAEYQPHDE